jgi:hypothetical protein
MSIRLAAAAAAALTLAALWASPASAEAPTRTEYVVRLEAICKPRVEATERVMKGVRADVRAERLGIAAGKFAKGTGIFAGTVTKMAPVPRPTADKERLKRWFAILHEEETWLRRITAALRERHTIQAQRDTARFIHTGNRANNVVIAFGFDYCSFRFSRFG